VPCVVGLNGEQCLAWRFEPTREVEKRRPCRV
jgi:hypothetical protein